MTGFEVKALEFRFQRSVIEDIGLKPESQPTSQCHGNPRNFAYCRGLGNSNRVLGYTSSTTATFRNRKELYLEAST